jgi:hypothetical protein
VNKKTLRERLIDAERRAAIAEHEAAVYRNQVRALIREYQLARGADEDCIVGGGSVFIFAGPADVEDDPPRPARSHAAPMPTVDTDGQAWFRGKPWPPRPEERTDRA